MNTKLEQQDKFFDNLCKLRVYARAHGLSAILDLPHLDLGCQYGRAVYNDSLSMGIKLYRIPVDGDLSHFGLEEDHGVTAAYWKTFKDCVYENRVYSMPFTAVDN